LPPTSVPTRPQTEMHRDEYRVMYQVEDQHWWYRGMRRNLYALLQRHWDWQAVPEPFILDAGCGTGANLQQFLTGMGNRLNTRRAVGFDLSEDALEFCRRRGLDGHLAHASITAIPFATGTFDIAISFDVINNLPDDRAGFDEVARVLKHNGLFILNLPAYQFLYSEHDLAIRGQRRYSARQVAQRLGEVGMRIERQTYLNTLLFPPAAAVRLLKARKVAANPTRITNITQPGSETVHTDLTPPHPAVNRALETVMRAEAQLLARTKLNLPFGLSVMTLARKL
jgi:SAM-dependent methyltransferase